MLIKLKLTAIAQQPLILALEPSPPPNLHSFYNPPIRILQTKQTSPYGPTLTFFLVQLLTEGVRRPPVLLHITSISMHKVFWPVTLYSASYGVSFIISYLIFYQFLCLISRYMSRYIYNSVILFVIFLLFTIF